MAGETMKDRIEDGGPAYPSTVQRWNDTLMQVQEGMSLRDRIALEAAPTLLTLHPTADYKTIALKAYKLADAMIEERNRR